MTNIQGDAVVPDYPTNVPAAGWYTDPSNPAQERWWGGVEWTHDVRPLVAAAPAPAQPVLANVPGGGINPFAAIDAQPAPSSAGLFGDSYAAAASNSFASPFAAVDTGSFSVSPNPFAATAAQSPFGTTAPQTSFGANISWYDSGSSTGSRTEPSNPQATAGLLLSIVGLNVFGIILSVLGLRRARGFEEQGDAPVGRKRSRWGLGLGIASLIISLALLAAYVFAFQYFLDLYEEQFGSGVVQTQELDDEFFDAEAAPEALPVLMDDGSLAVWDRAAMEQLLFDSLTQPDGTTADWVMCPDEVEMVVGESYECTLSLAGVSHTMKQTFTGQLETESSIDGVVQG